MAAGRQAAQAGRTEREEDCDLPVSVKKKLLRMGKHVGVLAFRAPTQGLESCFCCWTAKQGLAPKECLFHGHR